MEDRLDSWKSIANYLRRGVRTVQRWEQHEGLPVHRLEHDSKATVYAYKAELDAWWANGRSRLNGKHPAQQARTGMRRLSAGALVVLAFFALVTWLWPTSPHLKFEERDWVLVANFENLTGEAVFDETLQFALERELANSRFANVVPRERVRDSLRLMKLPPESEMGADIAREVALRDGGIRALAAGRIEKLDSTYLLSLSLINPADGMLVASFSDEAKGHGQVMTSIRGLSNKLRRSLGENLTRIHASDMSLERVTTPSLQALNFYTIGMRLVDEGEWERAIEFLDRAVTEDPDFASAHILLAHCLHNVGAMDAAGPHYVKAFELADATMDHERYFIEGSFYQRHALDFEKAQLAYESLLEIQPDHYWGNSNLSVIYDDLGRVQMAQQLRARLARLRPNDFWANHRAAMHLVIWRDDSGQTDEFVERMRHVVAAGDVYHGLAFRLFQAYKTWYEGEREAALSELEEMVREAQSAPGLETWPVANAAIIFMGMGKLDRAEDLLRSFDRPKDTHRELLAQLGLCTNRPQVVLEQVPHMVPQFGTVSMLVKIDRVDLAEELYARLVAPDFQSSDPWSPGPEPDKIAAEGALAFGRGELDDAITQLTEALELRRAYSPPTADGGLDLYGILSADLLAQAWEAKGELPRAAESLRLSVGYGEPRQFEWMSLAEMINEQKLAALHRRLGKIEEAERIEAELREWLAYADADHPILLALADQGNWTLID